MKLLLATDGSPDATAAITAAARVFRHEGLEADLLSIVPPLDLPEAGKGHKRAANRVRKAYSTRMRSEAEGVLAVAMEALRAEDLVVRPHIDEGSACDLILRRSGAYDVVVVGAHDRFGRSQPGVGPVGTQVITQSEASVFIGRELIHPTVSRILVCVDGSAEANRAVGRLSACIQMDQADVDVLHVVELPWLRLGLDPDWLGEGNVLGEDDYGYLDRLLSGESDRIVQAARRELDRQGVGASPILREGLPEAQILSETDVGEYDLILMGATGRSRLTHARLGSVSVRVAQDAPASVWLVR